MPTSIVIVCSIFLTAVCAQQYQLFPELTNAFDKNTNTLCAEHGRIYLENLRNLTLWAYMMWDASAHAPPVGVLTGNTHQLGDFDQCLDVAGPFQIQYCLAEIHMNIPSLPVPRDKYSTIYQPSGSVLEKLYYTGDHSRVPRNVVHMGLCVPASCTNEDVQNLLNTYLKETYNNNSKNINYQAIVLPDTCQTKSSPTDISIADIAFCLLIIALFIIVLLCTVYDFKINKKVIGKKIFKRSFFLRICLCFSARKNFNDLPRRDDSNPALGILYGMRTVSIFMIIMDHRFGTYITGPILNREFVEQHYTSFAALFVFHGDLFVDSFFVLSGLLVTYSLLVSFEKRISSPILIIFNRYVRLTPILAVVIFFYATILYKTGSGPLWKLIIGQMHADCKMNWWASLLYISNYVNDDHMCMVHSWYLPCDFHYFILAIPLVLLLRRKQKTGLVVLSVLLIISIVIPFAITIYYQRPALLHFYLDFLGNPKVHTDFRLTYTKSHTRAAAYIIGMFAGYVYYKLRNFTCKLSLIKSSILTFTGLLLMLGGMASGGIFYNPYHKYDAIEAAVYAALHRPAWAFGSAILLLNASYGRFGLMKNVLDWEPWVPISKLVYGAYLVHMCWQLRSSAIVKSPRTLNVFSVLTLALGDIIWSFALALFLYLTIEAPSRKVFRELMNPNRTRDEEKPDHTLSERVTVANGTEDSHL